MPDAPQFVSPYLDRHGKTRWRFRRGTFARELPAPDDPGFAEAYSEALAGRRAPGRRKARPAPLPRSLGAAWDLYRRSLEWSQMAPATHAKQTGIAERFLASPIAPGERMTHAALPLDRMRRKDVKRIIAARSDKPHAAEALLRLIRALCKVALDEEWIEYDPTYRVQYRPELIGHRAWSDDELAAYERRWPLGTPQRLAYALALYTGQRRADLAAMAWADFDGTGIKVVQEKTGEPLWIPAHPKLREALDMVRRREGSILTTAFDRQFTTAGFGNFMADSIGAAGVPDACRLHGLRRSAGRCLAEAGCSAKQIMAVLGHRTLAEAERYTRDADQRRLATDAVEQWARPRPALRVIPGTKGR